MIKAIIFDFDGVIHDTFEFHRNKIGEFTGQWLSKQEYRDIHNGNFYASGNDKFKSVDWIGYGEFTHEPIVNFKLEEDIKKMLLSLCNSYELFIVTSGREKNIGPCLQNNGVREIFKEVLGGESHKSKVEKFNFLFKKYSLNTNNVLFITDTLGDILEANEMNIKTIAVDFGYHPRETLEKGKPFNIVSSLEDLVKEIG